MQSVTRKKRRALLLRLARNQPPLLPNQNKNQRKKLKITRIQERGRISPEKRTRTQNGPRSRRLQTHHPCLQFEPQTKSAYPPLKMSPVFTKWNFQSIRLSMIFIIGVLPTKTRRLQMVGRGAPLTNTAAVVVSCITYL